MTTNLPNAEKLKYIQINRMVTQPPQMLAA
jgi:hypothetical protein